MTTVKTKTTKAVHGKIQPSVHAKAPVVPVKPEEKSRVRMKIRAFDHTIIDQASKTILETAERTGAKVVGPVPLPTEKIKYTVLRSSFVHKNARDQFETRVHKRLIDILEPTSRTIEALTNLNLPAGVDIEIKM